MRLEVRTREHVGPLDLATALPSGGGGSRWMFIRDGEGLVASGVAATIPVGTGPDRLATAAEALRSLAESSEVSDEVGAAGSGLIAFGSFPFDPEAPGGRLIVPAVIVGRRDGITWRTDVLPPGADPAAAHEGAFRADREHGGHGADGHIAPSARPGRVRYGGASLRDEAWLAAVAQALGRIEVGELEKVVLARDQLLWSRGSIDVDAVLTALHQRFPGCYIFAVDGLVGASPELLLGQRGRHVTSRVLAGTAARGRDAAADARLGDALLASEKDLREHALAVDSVREVLDPICSTLTVPRRPELLVLANVQHLASEVTGRLDHPIRGLELLDALHPTAAVGGTPRDRALDAIRALEGMPRGRYAGPVGWTDADGDGDWAIALRCAEIEGARARLFAGAGIVGGSLPEQELIETTLKFAAMRDVLDAAAR